MSKDEVVIKERSIVSKLFKFASEGNGNGIESVVTEYSNEANIPCHEVLLQFRDANKRTAIHFACSSNIKVSAGEKEVIAYLLELPWFTNDVAKELFCIKDHEGVTPLMLAAQQTNCPERVTTMLKVDPTLAMERSKVVASALHYASGAGASYEVIIKIHEADKAAIESFSTNGGTPLHWAAGGTDVGIETMSALIKSGASIDIENNQGLTPLIMAAASEKDKIASFLVEEGACKTLVYPGETTVFHVGADLNLIDTLKSLISADNKNNGSHQHRNWVLECISMRNHTSETPLDLAVIANHIECVQLLLPPGNVSREKAVEYIARTNPPKQKIPKSQSIDITKDEPAVSSETISPLDTKFIGEIEINAYQKGKLVLASHGTTEKKKELSEEHKKAASIKATGNQYFIQKNYEEALQYYTDAVNTFPGDATFYSNRSATYMYLQNYNSALEDAVICLVLNPDWFKAEYRLAMARLALSRYEDAAMAAWEGVKLAPDSKELKDLLKECVGEGRKVFLEKESDKKKEEDGGE